MSTRWQASLKEKRKHLKKPGVVIDKSYLHRISNSDAAQLNGNYLLLMGETLLYEISKDEKNRSRLMRNIREYSRIFLYAEHYHKNIEFEIKHGKKSPHPSHFFRNRDYARFEQMANGEFVDVSFIISERKDLIDKTVDSVIQLARSFRITYLEAFSGRDEVAKAEREKLEKKISDDNEFVRRYLKENATVALGTNGSALEKIAAKATEEWAHFRVAQATLLLAVDVAHRQKLNKPLSEVTIENIRHDVLDSQILILATLVGRIATRDDKIKRWWELLMRKPVDFGY